MKKPAGHSLSSASSQVSPNALSSPLILKPSYPIHNKIIPSFVHFFYLNINIGVFTKKQNHPRLPSFFSLTSAEIPCNSLYTMAKSFNGMMIFFAIFALMCACESRTLAKRSLAELVSEPPVMLKYHRGPVLSSIKVHVLWYGSFTASQRSIVSDFIDSLSTKDALKNKQPSVSAWWETTERYQGVAGALKKTAGTAVSSLGSQLIDEAYAKGKTLSSADITALVTAAVKKGTLPMPDGKGDDVYVVLTASDVAVEGFCTSKCGSHHHTRINGGRTMLPIAWVGNSEKQCPGMCAWPFHQPIYGPQTSPLMPPNGDVGVDGMVINMATVLAGSATNPFNNGFYQGDRAAPLEAVSACPGIYGTGAYPGSPGKVLLDPTTGASFNAYGVRGRQYLLPAMRDPSSGTCKTLV